VKNVKSVDVIVIGGGAAGLFCAFTAGQRGRSVLVLDSSNKVGKKILMSGGGRCNFTNLDITPENYLCNNPHFCISALNRYNQWQFIDLVERHGIAYHERKHGELFCDDSAKDILAMLLDECQQARSPSKLIAPLKRLSPAMPAALTCIPILAIINATPLLSPRAGFRFPRWVRLAMATS